MFNDAQKGLFPVIIIPCGILCYIFYRFGKKPLGIKTFANRMDYLYSLAAASLLGEFLFQALPNSTLPIPLNATLASSGPHVESSFSGIFIFLGFFMIFCYQKYSRVWHNNQYYVSPENSAMEIRNAIDTEKMEAVEYFQADSLGDDNVSEQRLKLADETVELTKRRFVAFLTLFIMSLLCVLEGFFLVYEHGNGWVILLVFVLDKMLETCIVCIAMLHAFFHATSEKQYNWYLAYAIWWCIVCCLSTIPVLVDMTQESATVVVTHAATAIFYAFACGVLFWIVLHYINIDQKKTDKRETNIRLCIFGITGAVSWVIGYFY